MRSVHSILRDLVHGDGRPGVKKEPGPLPPEEEKPKVPVKQPSPSGRLYSPTYQPSAPPTQVFTERSEPRDSREEECDHLWTWTKGVKQCKWCELVAPMELSDRRDATTSWRAKVYGRKS